MELTIDLAFDRLVKFVRLYGQGSSVALMPDGELKQYMDWFLANKRVIFMKNRGDLVGIGCALVLNSPTDLVRAIWPEETEGGEFLYIPFVCVRPDFRWNGCMKHMLNVAMELFPSIKYGIYYKRHSSKLIMFKLKEDL